MNRIQKINLNSPQNKMRSAFTLIEVLVVVAIIAVIATVTMVSLQNAKKNVDDKQLMQDFNELKVGLDQYKAVCKTYPLTLTAGANNSLSPAGTNCQKTLSQIMLHFTNISLVNYEYYPLARNSSPSYCNGYWLAVRLDTSNTQLSNAQNITPSKISNFLQSANNAAPGGWVRCSGSNAQFPLGSNASSYYGQTSSGVCPNPQSATCT